MQKEKKFDIISFYKFIILDDLEKHQLAIKKFLIDKNLKGTLILSPEGLNGTVSGVEGFVKKFNQFLFKNFSFDSYDSSNLSSSSNIPFDRPRVKIKKEVVPIEKNILKRVILEKEYNINLDICEYLLKRNYRDIDSLLNTIDKIGRYSLSTNKKVSKKNLSLIID